MHCTRSPDHLWAEICAGIPHASARQKFFQEINEGAVTAPDVIYGEVWESAQEREKLLEADTLSCLA